MTESRRTAEERGPMALRHDPLSDEEVSVLPALKSFQIRVLLQPGHT